MTTLTIKWQVNIGKTDFESIYELYDYLFDKYIDFKFIKLENLSSDQIRKYKESKKIKLED